MTTRTYKQHSGYELLTSAAPESVSLLTRLSRRLNHWQELSRQRRALAALDDRLLKDVGLDRAMAKRESARWFWDEPGPRG